MQKSIDDGIGDVDTSLSYEVTAQLSKTKSICSDDESLKTLTIVSTESNTETKTSPQEAPDHGSISETIRSRSEKSHTNDDTTVSATETDKITVNENGLLMLPESHPEYLNLIRLQLENHELNQWKQKLQRRIQNERAEVTRLKSILNARQTTSTNNSISSNSETMNSLPEGSNYERVAQYVVENTMLEQRKAKLFQEIFDENRKLIQLQVELAIRQFQI